MTGKKSGRKIRGLALWAGAALLLLAAITGPSRPALAQCASVSPCDTCCALVCAEHEITREVIMNEHFHQRVEVFGASAGILPFWVVPDPPDGFFRILHHERFLILDFFWENILPALMMMTEQLTSVMMEQVLITGTFFDAKQQLETQQLFQELTAKAHKDYHPTFGMCEFGTNTRSLAAADLLGDMSVMALNKRFMDRQMGNGGSVGSGGPQYDRASDDTSVSPTPYNRLGYFLTNTCDKYDVNHTADRPNTGLMIICANGGTGWVNRDIDWNITVMAPRTINVDMIRDPSDNNRLFEMSNYLYGHKVFSRPDGTLLETGQNQDNYLDSRGVIAKRSVAQDSFNHIIGLKARGTHRTDPGERPLSSEDTSAYMRWFMVELGFPYDDPIIYHRYMFHKHEEFEPGMDMIEDQISYYGQMEMLAKKIYQRPEFYTELYDKPANVKRKSAAMTAIKTMLDRDIFDSQLRAEMIMSMILELKVTEEQQNIENKLGLMREQVR